MHTIEKPLQTIVNAGKTIVDMASASTSSGILGDIVAKGPTTESQNTWAFGYLAAYQLILRVDLDFQLSECKPYANRYRLLGKGS